MDIENNSTETNVMLVGAFVSLLGAFTYCIKKAASNGIAFRSNCCKGAVEVDLDTNQGSPRNFYPRGTESIKESNPPSRGVCNSCESGSV